MNPDRTTTRRPHRYPCPTCGSEVRATAAHHARLQTPCLACLRTRNGWTCRTCASADPHHPSPCPDL